MRIFLDAPLRPCLRNQAKLRMIATGIATNRMNGMMMKPATTKPLIDINAFPWSLDLGQVKRTAIYLLCNRFYRSFFPGGIAIFESLVGKRLIRYGYIIKLSFE